MAEVNKMKVPKRFWAAKPDVCTYTDAVFSLTNSPQQDDFVVVHIPGEYDSVLETVFKTEFLTLLSSKYEDAVSKKLRIDINAK